MSESRALVLTFTAVLLAVLVAYIGLTLANATAPILTATILIIACVGAHILSRVVMRYAPPDQRHR
jgi:multisubunit Na+/H+ antiporter MnhG subunit